MAQHSSTLCTCTTMPTQNGYFFLSGDWKAQLEHIYTHLLDKCKKDVKFRNSLGRPKLGKVS